MLLSWSKVACWPEFAWAQIAGCFGLISVRKGSVFRGALAPPRVQFPMSASPHWSLYLARLRRVHLRFHALFLAVAVFALFLSTGHAGDENAGLGLLAVGVLFASVLAHEAGHCLAAIRVGGSVDQVVIGPLGGMVPPEVPRDSQAELFTALAGPLVNLGFVLLTLPLLVATNVEVTEILSPLEPTGLITGSLGVVTLKLGAVVSTTKLRLALTLPPYTEV